MAECRLWNGGEWDRGASVKGEGDVNGRERGCIADPTGGPDVDVGSEGVTVGECDGRAGDRDNFGTVDSDGGVRGVYVRPKIGLGDDTSRSGTRPEWAKFAEVGGEFAAIWRGVEAVFLPEDLGEGFPVEAN